jgi:hypothetical protein
VKLESFDHFGIEVARLVGVAILLGTLTSAALGWIFGNVLGQAAVEFDLTVFAMVFYIVVSTPHRIMEARRAVQAREAVLLTAVAAATRRVTGSRSRTMLMLKPKESELAETLEDARRMILLGRSVKYAAALSGRRLVSYSASNALVSVASPGLGSGLDEGEEVRGLTNAELLSRETKLPVFMTVCFFSPIMLMLYSVFSHITNLASLAQVVGLEIVVLDLAYFACSIRKRADL